LEVNPEAEVSERVSFLLEVSEVMVMLLPAEKVKVSELLPAEKEVLPTVIVPKALPPCAELEMVVPEMVMPEPPVSVMSPDLD